MATKLTELTVLGMFAKYNMDYFGGELPFPEFRITHSYRTLGMYSSYPTRDGHYGDVIEISDNYDYTESQLRDLIVHEMIHMYLMHFGIDKNCSHGKAFRDMMEDLNRRHGLHIAVNADVTCFRVRKGKSKFMKALCTLF